MGVLATSKNHVQLFFNSKNSLGKQTLAYIQSSEKPIRSVDTQLNNFTSTQWTEIAEGLNMSLSKLIDQNHPDFKKEFGDGDVNLDDKQWLKILTKKPYLVVNPILVAGKKMFSINTPSDILKYLEPDSASIDKPYTNL